MDEGQRVALMKQRVGIEAARMVEDGMVVGIGTGSTAVFTIRELGRRIHEEGLSCMGIPTSYDAAVLARSHGVPLTTLDDVERIDIAIDGADEVDPAKRLIKGRGAAHTREKIVDSLADTFVVVVDASKLVDRLGTRCPVPVEVLPMAVTPVMRRLRGMGAVPTLRMGVNKDGPVITDQGNMVIDARFDGIDDPRALETAINSIPGVLENGLFIDLATLVLIGRIAEDGAISVDRME